MRKSIIGLIAFILSLMMILCDGTIAQQPKWYRVAAAEKHTYIDLPDGATYRIGDSMHGWSMSTTLVHGRGVWAQDYPGGSDRLVLTSMEFDVLETDHTQELIVVTLYPRDEGGDRRIVVVPTR